MSRMDLSLKEQIGALVDDGLLKLLPQAFPPLDITPDTSLSKVMFEAGVQKVISFLRDGQKQARSLG